MSLDTLIEQMGPETNPFGRKPEVNQTVHNEEKIDFSQMAFNAINDGSPEPKIYIQLDEVEKLPKDKMFIWLVYLKNGEVHFKMIPDSTENPDGKKIVGGRKNVCHTNLSAGEKALQGGECWWCEDSKTMYVNRKSGRYGAITKPQWDAVLEFFKFVGYQNVVDSNFIEWNN